MQFLEDEIRQVACLVWESVLGLTLEPGAPAATPQAEVSGCVQFTGAWEGAVTIECTADFARRAAATMFGVEPENATVADTQDAIGELTNMTGGNVKALLPEPCRLSLPSVVQGNDFSTRVPGGELVTQVHFECAGSPLVVRLLRRQGDRAGGAS